MGGFVIENGKCAGLNRTFMELKSATYHTSAHTTNSLNRTFMELKFWQYRRLLHFVRVLIEPLWN